MQSKIPHSNFSNPAHPSGSVKSNSEYQSRSIPNHDARTTNKVADAKDVFNSLRALGAPETLTLDDFARLYHGSLADALLFVSGHVRGRQEVARVRGQIHRAREERAKSHIKHPDDRLRSVADKAASSLSSANKTLEVTKKQLDKRLDEVQRTQTEVEELQEELIRKGCASIYFDVLEKRETLRIKRFEEMGNLMDDLRKKIAAKSKIPPTLLPTREYLPQQKPVCHTRNTLANLHAYHIRIQQLQRDQLPTSAKQLEAKLKEKILQQQADTPEADKTMQRIISIARSRAIRRTKYRCELRSPSAVSKENVEEKSRLRKTKEQELQRLLDQSAALAYLSENYIHSMSTFLEKTSLIIQKSIEEEATLTNEYVDVLRRLIANNAKGKSKDKSFASDVRAACGIIGHVVPAALISQFKERIIKCHEQSVFLTATNVIAPRPPTDEEKALLAAYQADARKAEDRAYKLLTRKVEKIDKGFFIATDIEELLREARTIVS